MKKILFILIPIIITSCVNIEIIECPDRTANIEVIDIVQYKNELFDSGYILMECNLYNTCPVKINGMEINIRFYDEFDNVIYNKLNYTSIASAPVHCILRPNDYPIKKYVKFYFHTDLEIKKYDIVKLVCY